MSPTTDLRTVEELLETPWIGKENFLTVLDQHPEFFDGLIKNTIRGKDPCHWRAAWLLRHGVKRNDPRLIPHINELIMSLGISHDGYQREVLNLLDRLELDEDQEGLLLDHCGKIWASIAKKPGTRYVAIKKFIKIADKYPELHEEIKLFTQKHYLDTLSPGIKRSLLKLVKKYHEK